MNLIFMMVFLLEITSNVLYKINIYYIDTFYVVQLIIPSFTNNILKIFLIVIMLIK